MQDPLWMRAFLAVHITAGSGAFVLAPLALVTAKGGKAHRLWGKIYFWCMTVVAATAMVMALYRPMLFLALVAVFSFYSAFVAYRVLGQKAAWKGESVAKPLDWIAAVICFTASAALALLGAFKPVLVQNLAIPAIVFGAIGMRIAGNGDVELYTSSKGKNVLVVRPPAGHDRQLYRRVDRLLCGNDRTPRTRSMVAVGAAYGDWRSRDYRHDCVLQRQICVKTEGGGCIAWIRNLHVHARQEPIPGRGLGCSPGCRYG